MFMFPKRTTNRKEHTMANRDEFGAFVAGFLIGGVSAAIAALLFAPQSGAETRQMIKDRSIELRDQAQQSLEEALARAEAAATEARIRADEMARTIKEQGQSAVEAVRSAAARKPDGEPTA
jgi:gas vesicle protein